VTTLDVASVDERGTADEGGGDGARPDVLSRSLRRQTRRRAPRRREASVAFGPRRTAARFENATNERAASFSSLPPLDLGDPEKYRRLRETLGVEAALRTPLAQLLAPLEATNGGERGREKGNPDLFVPLEMPRGLLLPFAQHEAYGRLKLREIQQEDGSVGYATRAADGAGAPR